MTGLVLFLLSSLELQRTGATRTFVAEPYSTATVLEYATHDSATVVPGSSDLTRCFPSSRYLLAHLARPVTVEALDRLRAQGLEPVGYMAYQNVICRRVGDVLPRSDPGVTFVALPSAAKLAPGLRQAGVEARLLAFALWPGEDQSAAAAALAAAGIDVRTIGPRTITGAGDPMAAVGIDAVAWVQPAAEAVAFNERVQWVVQSGWRATSPGPDDARPMWEHGIRGQDVVIGLFDSGINTGHSMFWDTLQPITAPGVFPNHRKIAAYKLFREALFGDAAALGYHGSAVAGTLAGSDAPAGGASLLDGAAIDARIFFLDVGTTSRFVYYDDVTEMLDSVRLGLGMPEPVRQVSGSFGSNDALGYYLLAEATADAVCWRDKDFLVIWSAGNNGGPRYRIGHPSCAKNILTVGGSGNGVRSNLAPDFSSRGPTRDERIKPNIVAPAESVATVLGSDTTGFVSRTGTSYAAPAASGALALARQYFRDGWHPAGRPDPTRRLERLSSALYRALAIAAADSNCGVDFVPNPVVGWGRLNLSRVLHFEGDATRLAFVDERGGLATGEFDEYRFDVYRRDLLRVALAWTDTAATPLAGIALVNDLNLELVSPDNNTYRGNQFLQGQSISNPPDWDERNVEEVCQLFLPVTGRWRVRVYGRNIYTARQPYALVVRAGLGESAVADEVTSGPMPLSRAAFATRVRPLRLELGPGENVVVFSVDGRRNVAAFGPGCWSSRDLRPGVYRCEVGGGGVPCVVRLVVAR